MQYVHTVFSMILKEISTEKRKAPQAVCMAVYGALFWLVSLVMAVWLERIGRV